MELCHISILSLCFVVTVILCVINLPVVIIHTVLRCPSSYCQPLYDVILHAVTPTCCHSLSCHLFLLSSSFLSFPFMSFLPFLRCSGYKFLYDFLIEMDRRERDDELEKKEEAQNATHQMMNLLFNLCFQGYVDLHPTITEPGPYQAANFQVPIAAGGGEE